MRSNHKTTNSESTNFLANMYYDFFFKRQTEKNLKEKIWENKIHFLVF